MIEFETWKKSFKFLSKTFGHLKNSLYFCSPKSREAGSEVEIKIEFKKREIKAYEKKVLKFLQKYLVIKKLSYTFALAIRNKRQKEFPELKRED